LALQNAGGIRSGLGPGPVTVWDIYSALPFDNKLVKLGLSGAKVEELVGDIARRVGRGSFCQVSGISFEVIDKKPHDIKVGGKPLERDRTYTVGAIDYLVDGGCRYDAITQARVLYTTSGFQRDFAVEYLRKLKVLRPRTEGRIKVSRGRG
jgi:2',3'-cyclic-nucleotide 2'-phosphodiesterase (5'-nucleotidase family)